MLISDIRDEVGSVRDLLRDSLNPDIGRDSADAIIFAARERLDSLYGTLDSECDRPDYSPTDGGGSPTKDAPDSRRS